MMQRITLVLPALLACSIAPCLTAGELQLASGSVVTSGAMDSFPLKAIRDVVGVTAGGSVTVARTCDGRRFAIGSNGSGLIDGMPAEAVEMAIGNAQGVAILRDGSLRVWGSISTSNPPPTGLPAGALAWTGVAAGGQHGAAWTDDGQLAMWGNDDFGQCQHQSRGDGSGWSQLALGGSHSIGISTTQRVFAWGLNSSGQAAVPSSVDGARTVAAGLMHSVAVTTDGHLVGWGSNSHGQLSLPGTDGWTDVKTGALHTVALRREADGHTTAWAFGDNTFKQCEIGEGGTRSRALVGAIAAGLYHTASVDEGNGCLNADLQLRVAGKNFYGEAGTIDSALVDVANGDGFVVGIRQDRSLVAWGSDTDGVRTVPSGSWYAACAAGPRHAAAITTDGYLYVWGSSADGKTTAPDLVAGERWSRIACGSRHTVGLLTTGAVRAWGSNAAGQTAVPAALLATGIAAGNYFSAATATDGTPVIWGANTRGNLLPPSTLRVRSLAAGSEHVIAVTTDGRATAWGDDAKGQCTVPALGQVISVAASGTTSAALLLDGSIAVWGSVRQLDGTYVPATAPSLPSVMDNGRALRTHRLSVGGESVSVLVGHEYVANHDLGPYYTIQDAIDAAPVGAVVRVAAGRWFPRQIRSDMTGLELRGDITLTAENPDATDNVRGTWLYGSAFTTPDPRDRNTSLSSSMMTVWNNESPACLIRGFTFYMGEKGRIWPANPASVVGGGIYVGQRYNAQLCAGSAFLGASPTIEKCRFKYCFAGYGGAIFLSRSRAAIRDCTFDSNSAQTSGGALYSWAHNGTVERCNFVGNQAVDKDGGASAIVTVSDQFMWCASDCQRRASCELVGADCTTRYDRGAPTYRGCTFTRNFAYGFGGGVAYGIGYRHPDAVGPDGTPLRWAKFEDCVFDANVAKTGGGGMCVTMQDKQATNPAALCPYPAETGIELLRCVALNNSATDHGAARYSDLQGPYVDHGGNQLNRVGNPCPLDLDGSGTIDHGDLAIVLMLIGTSGVGDLDDNGLVDFGDVVFLLVDFGPCR